MGTMELARKLEARLDWPVMPTRWQVESGEDAIGQYALWIWVTVAGALSSDLKTRFREKIRAAVLQELDPDPSWVYVRFKDEAESEAEAASA